jgi:hypothetical protein
VIADLSQSCENFGPREVNVHHPLHCIHPAPFTPQCTIYASEAVQNCLHMNRDVMRNPNLDRHCRSLTCPDPSGYKTPTWRESVCQARMNTRANEDKLRSNHPMCSGSGCHNIYIESDDSIAARTAAPRPSDPLLDTVAAQMQTKALEWLRHCNRTAIDGAAVSATALRSLLNEAFGAVSLYIAYPIAIDGGLPSPGNKIYDRTRKAAQITHVFVTGEAADQPFVALWSQHACFK